MGADDDKKKKKEKKSKKKEAEAAPEPESEPEPVPEPEPVVEDEPAPAPADDEGASWLDAPADEGEGGFDYPPEGEDLAPPPPAKKKPLYYIHWDRKKSRFYDYNFDYGENYYSSMVRHLDTRGDIPHRRTFEDRAIRSSITRKTLPDTRTENLLAEVSKSIRSYESSRKQYMWN